MSTLETEPAVAIAGPVDHSRQKLRWLIVFVVWSFVYGLLSGVVPQGQGRLIALFLANGVVCTVAMSKWTLLDVAERGFQLRRFFFPMLVAFPGPVVMTPVYFFQSRPRREAWRLCVQAAIFYAAVQGAIVGAMYLVGSRLLAG